MPKINATCGRDTSVPIHERLYSLTRESMKSNKNIITSADGTYSNKALLTEGSTTTDYPAHGTVERSSIRLFSPTINAKSSGLERKQPIDVLLYSDAKRRQEKDKEIEKK